MAILQGDIKLKKTQVMQDVPEGGGAPTPEDIPDGGNNTIFPDVSETDRAGGRFNLRKVVVHVDTANTDEYMGANVIVARPPDDPNVSVALLSSASLFDTRTDAVNRVEGYLTAGALWQGYLYTDHVVGQRAIQIFQRPGTTPPTIGRTLVLTHRQGMPDQKQQYVRVLNRTVSEQTFTFAGGGNPVEYQAMIVMCELSDPLRYDFVGSEASRFFTAESGKTILRDTTVADSGSYCGTQPLVEDADLGAVRVKVASVYTQLVPNSRTERTELDVLPAAVRNITLQESPRRVEVATSPHTRRLKILQENRAFSYVDILRPLPAPGTLDVSYMALGEWYSIRDNGSGRLEGSGSGTVNYATGSVSVTCQAMPDPNTMLIYTWGERTAFTNRAGQAGFRAPEYVFVINCDGIKPGTGVVTWTSGGVLRTANASSNGTLSGDATGQLNHAENTLLIRPTHMIDSGGQFEFSCEESVTTTNSFTSSAVDAGGFATFTLSEAPAPGSVSVEWVTVRNVSKTSGGSASSIANSKSTNGSNGSVSTGSSSGAGTIRFTAPADGTGDGTPTKHPVSTSRTDTGVQLEVGMYPGGRDQGQSLVYIAVEPTMTAEGDRYEYVVPDVAGVVWTEEEVNLKHQKTIDGTLYRQWGFHTN